jgi:ubiquinone/menaquinone biosynthesis C-methylase UbiE
MTTQQEKKDQQKEEWSAAAATWEQWGEWMDAHLQPLAAWFCTAADVGPGKRILDLACGAGQPAMTMAREARPAGQIVATDISPGMLAVARRRAAAAGITNIEFQEMDAEDIKFLDASFDAVTMRFGLMFCPEPGKAASEIRRVLKQGCPFAIAVWDEPSKNPRFSVITEALGQLSIAAQAPNPDALGPFRLSRPGALEAILKEAGFSGFTIESRQMTFEYESPQQFWDVQSKLSAPLQEAVKSLAPGEAARLRAAVIEAVQPYVIEGRVGMPATALCATGVK